MIIVPPIGVESLLLHCTSCVFLLFSRVMWHYYLCQMRRNLGTHAFKVDSQSCYCGRCMQSRYTCILSRGVSPADATVRSFHSTGYHYMNGIRKAYRFPCFRSFTSTSLRPSFAGRAHSHLDALICCFKPFVRECENERVIRWSFGIKANWVDVPIENQGIPVICRSGSAGSRTWHVSQDL